jgi:hypothetical protein
MNDMIARIRKIIKARCKSLSVRHGRGTAYSWCEISGSGPGGEFSQPEREALESFNMSYGVNFDVMDYEEQGIFLERYGGEPSRFIKSIMKEATA